MTILGLEGSVNILECYLKVFTNFSHRSSLDQVQATRRLVGYIKLDCDAFSILCRYIVAIFQYVIILDDVMLFER